MIGISKAAWYQLFPSKTGNFLTPRADISFAGLDEYAIRKKIIESKITKLNTDTSKYKTSETVGETNEVKQKKKPMSVHELVVPKPKINRDKVIIEDWYSDDVSEVNTVSPVKTNETQTRSYYTRPAVRPKDLKQDVKTSGVKNMTTAGTRAVVNTGKGKMDNALKKSRWVWRPKGNYMDHESKEKGYFILKKFEYGNPEICLQDHAVVDSGCSSHMTGNKAYLLDYEDYNGGFVAFGSDPKGGKITGKGKIRTANLDFDDCPLLSPSFKLLDENQVVLRAPRQNGVYSLDLKNIVPSGGQIPIDASTLPNADLLIDPNMPDLEDDSNVFPNDGIFSRAHDDEDVGAEADFNNMDNTIYVNPIPTLRVHKDHLKGQILGDPKSAIQTRGKIQKASSIQQALKLVDLPFGKKAIGTKWFFRNKRDERSIVVKNKAKLVTQGFRKEEATTPIESNKPLVKDKDGIDVDVHVCRSMIGSLMYLTASRPDIMFVVCACARFQVTPKASHLNAVKRIFRYLKHQPKLGLWYLRDSPFELEAFSDSDYGGASLDRKSTTGGCQFLGRRVISWQCKKQTIVANSTTKEEYVAAANCCGQVLWIQNQMMDYGFNFMNTKIHIDNKSTIYLLTKGFDVTRFNFLVVNIGMINL
ncbi:putative ribonuclease H-like domain-containing protein [Tanacetum coccineum]